jgi:O-glycosyl hydrolase
MGGSGPTSAITQMARGLASFLLGFQRTFGVPFHAISIQNEPVFEVFYHSCAYRKAGDYVAALKAVRRELDRHPELRAIQIMGPEDLLGGDGYSLWQYGRFGQTMPTNLQFMAAVADDAEAARALSFFAVHGYAPDGVQSAGGDPVMWQRWSHGWSESPNPGLPEHVRGARDFGKKSWMTETSGELPRWQSDSDGDFGNSALGLAVKIHQALSTGEQSAWLYWQFAEGGPANTYTLTDASLREKAPKYVAAKHFFRFIRPGARRVEVQLPPATALHASAFFHERDDQLTLVVINAGPEARSLELGEFAGPRAGRARAFLSRADQFWQELPLPAQPPLVLELPPRSLLTLTTVEP